MYLFLFAALFIIFQYANVKKTYEAQEHDIKTLKIEVEEAEATTDSLLQLNSASIAEEFTLDGDEKARMYIEDLGYNINDFKTSLENFGDEEEIFFKLKLLTRTSIFFSAITSLLEPMFNK